MSWMRRYIGLSTARVMGLPVPGYWNQLWDRRCRATLSR